MNIKMCTGLGTLNIAQNIASIEEELKDVSNTLVLFPESYLQGFHSITFDYREDIKTAISKRSVEIANLQKLCKETNNALGIGYYENHQGGIYDSYMLINRDGEIVLNYRRVNENWKIPSANADYREGLTLKMARLMDRDMGIAICGDLWDDSLLTAFCEMDARCDFIIWPCHLDYRLEEWESELFDYAKRSEIFEKPILLLNTYLSEIDEEKLARGGLYLFHQGKIKNKLPMGRKGVMVVEV